MGFSSGFKILDNELPNSSWTKSCLIELISKNTVETDIIFIIPTLKQSLKKNQKIIIFTHGAFNHYKNLLSSGIAENQLIIVNPKS
jgi:hypothetical protein